ncbi:unnamed protein product [Paramecium sonneborni]|uniref:WD40-repeat-containing domain n=1 Tax=Paramecium sonneborni TaxID=65129 RepID=A0A8S1QWS3_9CILI|nr:unnamed protein product [Paramecium sonneborni]
MKFNCLVNEHTKKIDYYCINKYCKDNRLSCQQCRAEGQHYNCYKWLKDYDDLIEFSENYNKSVKDNYQKIEQSLDVIGELCKQLQNEYKEKYFIQLNGQNIQQVHNLLSSMLQFSDNEQAAFQKLTSEIQQIQQKIESILFDLKNLENSRINQNSIEEHQLIQQFSQRENDNKAKFDNQYDQNNFEAQSIKSGQTKQLINLKPKINYELLNNFKMKQEEWCLAIAFHSKQSIIACGYGQNIKIFKQEKQLKQLQILTYHTERVTCLSFLKKKNQLVSGSIDFLIIIWKGNQSNNYQLEHKLGGHQNRVVNLITNKNDDLIISCGMDCQIRFWNQNIEWKCSQIITDHSKRIFSLSLNDSENMLISCSEDSMILVMQKQTTNKKQWEIKQKIILESYGCRICFINDEMFAFQPWQKEVLLIFSYNKRKNEFQIKQQIQIQGGQDIDLFPQQFIKQKSLLINKNSKYVQFFKFGQDNQIQLELTIMFQDIFIYGAMSEDGEYLLTWDWDSKEFQIRKFK